MTRLQGRWKGPDKPSHTQQGVGQGGVLVLYRSARAFEQDGRQPGETPASVIFAGAAEGSVGLGLADAVAGCLASKAGGPEAPAAG